ncbi:hypothetical protein BJ322DRAFT_113506 [Thelephora terrestris]|uniref:Calcineurin-like phosphoesterase domain-containing protein n=1 Tax=Thelephora terrestris TaxID=56493 RepID=A0A9P6HU09_9AGAM|nr:hypothetical protein BJ322DRAFT_113506 [Thelephora terrestris]
MGFYGKRKSVSRATSPDVVQKAFIALWCLTVIWCEVGFFHLSLKDCRWPEKHLKVTSKRFSHILVVSDTQIKNPAIAPSWTSSFFAAFERLLFDLHLKKSWHFAMHFKPHHIIFLGDMMASGRRAVSDEEYATYYETFTKMFPKPSTETTVHYLPGNNDVGLNMDPIEAQHARRRFTKHFGPLDQTVDIQNHTLVLLDASRIIEESYRRARKTRHREVSSNGTMNFVKSVQPGDKAHPVILFTHVPLFRPDSAACGPLRESGTIRRGAGNNYQSTIGKDVSAFLLEHLHPTIILSGDDRDYCEFVHHRSGLPPIREVTVKSFSEARGIRRPGFQLLTVFQPSPALATTHLDMPCFLPNEHGIYYAVYLPLALVTVILLLICNIRQPRRYQASTIEDESTLNGSEGSLPLLSPLMLSPNLPTSIQLNVRSPMPNSGTKFYSASHARLTPRTLSPLPSPLASPRSAALNIEDEDYDELYPTQYATRRDDRPPIFLTGVPPEFQRFQQESRVATPLSAKFPGPDRLLPRVTHRRAASTNYTWSFVFGGRRRRIAIPILTREQVWGWCRHSAFFASDLVKGRRVGGANLARDMLMDCLSVFLAASLTWSAICWWFLG